MNKTIFCLVVIAMIANIYTLPADSAPAAAEAAAITSTTAAPSPPAANPADDLLKPLTPLNGIVKSIVLAKEQAVNKFLNMLPGSPALPVN